MSKTSNYTTSFNMATLDHFHLFPLLPPELRLHIYSFTLRPRVVTLYTPDLEPKFPNYDHKLKKLICSTPVPAILHINSEARTYGLSKYYAIETSEWSFKIAHDDLLGQKFKTIYFNAEMDLWCLPIVQLQQYVARPELWKKWGEGKAGPCPRHFMLAHHHLFRCLDPGWTPKDSTYISLSTFREAFPAIESMYAYTWTGLNDELEGAKEVGLRRRREIWRGLSASTAKPLSERIKRIWEEAGRLGVKLNGGLVEPVWRRDGLRLRLEGEDEDEEGDAEWWI